MNYTTILSLCCAVAVTSHTALAQQQSPEQLQSVQREKLEPLGKMNGAWRGQAWIILPSGEKMDFVQTERVGPMLGGTVKVIEGRGYDKDGKVVFNAFASLAYDATNESISMQSYAQGRVGNFTLKPTEKGYSWEISAGPATIRYVAEITDGKWFEYGERIIPGRDPFRFIEMTLTRVGDTDWPAADPVPMVDTTQDRS
ncbi:MAG: hypothetical protein KDB00_19890 [Planctomycetales bacterium]|nr:hypothetical protein [Planctomycetales bacterium]